MIEHLLKSADFERVLGTRTRVNSLHFALHHLPGGPIRSTRGAEVMAPKLSTGEAGELAAPVDDSAVTGVAPMVSASERSPDAPAPHRLWLGTVVPKRHARRSVTRSLLKRQMRQVVTGCEGELPSGIWVLRLRAPFDRSRYPSAASDAMKAAARAELEQLLADAVAHPAKLLPTGRRR